MEPLDSVEPALLTPDAANANPENADTKLPPHFVIGIGASAGGLEAIEHFFDHVPADSGLSFVVVQHLSPDFKSLMDELLARHTKMPIYRVEDGMTIEPNAIYLIPRKKNMVLSFGKLMLNDQDQKPGPNLPIDIFLQSLARDRGDRAVAVILSGTGSDGSRGLREIHEAGGLVIVQDPDTAAFDGMPKSALATGLADLVLPPAAMAERIVQYSKHPVRAEIRKAHLDIQSGDNLPTVFSLLRRHFGVDFSLYKPSTLSRRLERRMTLQNTESLGDYIAMLGSDVGELDHLYRDLLVEVTQFFRDKDAFDVLKNNVIPKLFEQASPDDGIRIWVPGCATGEEAYSLAMLFHEYAQIHRCMTDVKIFATDVHRTSLEIAGAGIYREGSVADMPRAYLERYFVRKLNQFVVHQDVRKMVIFAPHNLTKDPPFTKLDLISCRNVLIYLNPATQRKVLTLFHFGLRTGGVLFQGPSESVADLEQEFDVVEPHWKIFRKRRDIRLHPGTGLATMPVSETVMLLRQPLTHQAKGEPYKVPELYESLLARYVPPSLLLNEHHELVHSFGNARTFLQIPEGKATTDVLKMLDNSVRIAVSSALHQAAKSGKPVVYAGVRTRVSSTERLMKVTVVPLPNKRTQSNFCQVCLELEEALPVVEPAQSFDVQGESTERISSLERELAYAKEHLQSTVEELETSNEELQSTNEELVASNEQLQSTNEELHSVNEELYTVNAEHQRKIEELIQVTSDMDNLLASTDIGTIFLDLDLKIRKFTPAVGRLFNLLPQDIGRPFKHISNNLDLGHTDFLDMIERMHGEGKVQEREIEGPQKRFFLMRVLPYQSQNGQTAGTVLTFVDITAVKEAEQELGVSQRRLDAMLENSTEARDALARRDQFLAMLSHELRNPLNAILNAAQILGRIADSDLHQEARDVIQRQVEQMSRLLDDLLDVTRISQNRIRLQSTVLDLRGTIRDAVAVVKQTFQSANINLDVAVGDEAIPVTSDAARLQQMLVNLLANAAKYTPAGGNVRLSTAMTEEQVVLHVKDSGVGIRPEMLEKVFDLFVQAHETLDRAGGGMGVGLTLVRTIAELHGGTVKARSEGQGKGSEFVVHLPRSRERPVESSAAPTSPAEFATVLIIEDNSDGRRMLEAMLKLDGYKVHSAADGQEGLEAILKLRPQFAIVDIGLPGLDGYQVARQARAVVAKDEVYLIALTGYGRPEDRRAVLEAGFDEHLVKPLKPSELVRVLGSANERRNATLAGEPSAGEA